jgi:hypothetical protein
MLPVFLSNCVSPLIDVRRLMRLPYCLCVCLYPLIVSFSMWFVSCQRTVGDCFFSERLLLLRYSENGSLGTYAYSSSPGWQMTEWSICWMLGEKPALMPIRPPQIPYRLPWHLTQDSVVRNRILRHRPLSWFIINLVSHSITSSST